MPVTLLPPAPRATNLGTFSTLADNFFTALPGMVTEINALADGWSLSGVTSVAGASAVDFTGIPAGVLELKVFFDSVLPTGTDAILVQVGNSGGFVTTGYETSPTFQTLTTSGASATSVAGFKLHGVSGYSVSGAMGLFPVPVANLCACDCAAYSSDGTTVYSVFTPGAVPVTGNIDRIRVTRVGASNFVSGSVVVGWRL